MFQVWTSVKSNTVEGRINMMGELVGQGHASSALKHGAIAHIDVWNIDVVILKKSCHVRRDVVGRTDGRGFV